MIARNETARNLSLAAEVAALFVVLVLALPGSRSPVPAPAARAEGAREPAAPRAEGARQPGDGIEAGYPVAAGTATPDPFGTYGEPEPGPARTPEPALGVARHLDDEDPAPWAGLAPQIPQTPALRDRPDPAPSAPGAAAPPPRRRGAHAARHGKPSRRSRGDG